jgi:hypothetical protein
MNEREVDVGRKPGVYSAACTPVTRADPGWTFYVDSDVSQGDVWSWTLETSRLRSRELWGWRREFRKGSLFLSSAGEMQAKVT